MENFKEIAEKCLAGELSGTFKLASGESVSSYNLERLTDELQSSIYQYQMCVNGTTFLYTIYGTLFRHRSYALDIINFIPDNMQEQIKIDIPEGKVPVMEQTEKGVVITWKEKELTYAQIYKSLLENGKIIHYIENPEENTVENLFIKKVNVLRKLINIRNYFGKCDKTKNGYHICKDTNCYDYSYKFIVREFCICDPHEVVFAKKEHAEQAIKMLGDELKYLFEPW